MNLNPRFYTDRQNRILLPVVRAAATRRYMPQGRAHHVRRFTIHQQVRLAYEAAQREQERFAAHPLTASINRVDAIIARHCVGGHDSLIREAAILAHADRRPAAITRRYNPHCMLAINALHAGEDLVAHLAAQAALVRLDLAKYADRVFECLVPVDRSTADLVEEVRWGVLAAGRGPDQFLQAAE